MSAFRPSCHAAAPVALACALAFLVPTAGRARASASARPDLSGTWTLNPDLSDHPDQIAGFGRGGDTAQPGNGGRGGGLGGRGGAGRGGFGRGGFGGGRAGGFGAGPRENDEDRLRVLELTDNIRNPSRTLTVTERDDTVSITDAENTTRVFHANGKKETQQLPAVKISSKTRWDGDRLITEFDVGRGRTIRFTYSLAAESRQLVVAAEFDAGTQSKQHAPIKRVYDAAPDASR